MDRLLTVREAAQRLGLAVATVRKMMRNGELVVVRPTGRRAVRVRESDIAARLNGSGHGRE